MKNVREFVYPGTLDEAVQALMQAEGKVRIIAGGTSISQSKDPEVEVLVDVTRLGLRRIAEEGDALRLEACATADQISKSDRVSTFGIPALGEAARQVGPAGVRNAVTIAGNVIQCYPWSDMPVALLALETRVVTAGPNGRTWVLDDMFARHPTRQLAPGELVTHFLVTRPAPGSGNAFIKFARTAVDFALITSAASVELEPVAGAEDPSTDADAVRVKSLKVVVGAARSLPSVVLGLAAHAGPDIRPDPAWRARVAASAQDAVRPTADFRASAEYRSELVGVMVSRVLEVAVKRALESLQSNARS
jgi:CO/xanthine dehydrogenase FAD-binding subunit